MREPFIRHARLLIGARRWQFAKAAYAAARIERYADIVEARGDGYTLKQIADAYGLTRGSVEIILQKGRRESTPNKQGES